MAENDPFGVTKVYGRDSSESPLAVTTEIELAVLPEHVGRYRVERVLGRGGFGIVYLAYDDQLDRPVAVKVPHRRLVPRPEDAAAYLAEARTVAKLDHPHIVPVHDVGSTGDFPCFIVSKYIDGKDLATRLRYSRPSPPAAAQLVATVADALHYAHKQGLVHRDVKTGNILVDGAGKPYIVDFGLAQREENIGKGPKYIGTPAYMSPEQARGEGHRIDGRSDVFSLGVVLYELLTGRQPFAADSLEGLLHQIAAVEACPARQFNDAIPKELDRICQKALAKRATERYATARDMASDLCHYLAEAPTPSASIDVGPDPTVAAAKTPSSTPTSLPDSFGQPVRIIPKGLRSFDAADSEFFLELLPGPRDRDGLPDSIRFWKSRVECRDGEAALAVGLIYGPSGCGKSSLVKAGLLPRLNPAITTVYVEATAEETEARLLSGLRRRLPHLPPELGLVDTLAALRRGEPSASHGPVLLVLDQFEQWLHARRNEEDPTLVDALRQCDGARLRCLVMVRDDFWLAVSRFMKSLEIEILEGHNSALADLFDPLHARKVLAAFGRAYGRLPDNPGRLAKDENAFLDQAVAGLTQQGKVVPVRLALFAEMVKGKPWTPATLKQVGGAEGVGVTFLEETFSATTAPPQHRYHQKAARAVLKSLLPHADADIKGHMRSHQELLEASGYAARRDDFANLMRILDSEIRLITPTDLEGAADGEPAADRAGEKYYQLSHDYLVPSLQKWLVRKQRDTRRGRAELCLADRAALWNARPENRRLPAWWEWLNIRLFTRARDWTAPQRTMMRRAGRRLAAGAALAAVALAALAWVGRESYGRMRAQALTENLLRAPTAEVPAIVRDMTGFRHWLDRPLADLRAAAAGSRDARQQLHLSLALLPADATQTQYLVDRLLTGSPEEVAAVRALLAPRADAVVGQLWKVLENRHADPGRRLRAASALAAYAPSDPRWTGVSGDVASALVSENALLLKAWADGLRPVAHAMLPALAAQVAGSRGPVERRTLAGLYAEFAAEASDGFAPLEQLLAEKPGPDSRARIELAQRQATVAAALAAAGRWDVVWPLLRHSSNPTLRTYLIERLATGGAAPTKLIERLMASGDSEPSSRRAMILALADFSTDRLSAGDRELLLPYLTDLYRRDADAGARAAAGWLLGQWGQHETLAAIDRELASAAVDHPGWRLAQNGQMMVVLPPGAVEAHDPSGEVRVVEVARRFAIAARETTVAEYQRFREGHAVDRHSAQTDDCPVNEVSWYDAAAYCNWLSRQDGIDRMQWCYEPNDRGEYAAGMRVRPDALTLTGYRLPTAAEWEYACRAGSSTPWSMGEAEDALDRYAWSMRNAGMRSHPVGLLRPNDFGLFDMQGNVWEYCHEESSAQGDATAAAPGEAQVVLDQSYRVLRGGTYLNDAEGVVSATRNGNSPNHRTGADGFRVVRTMP
jgi:serine/threonine protein kinase/formylglycine-generating enzyme required for sulfatase activity